MSGCLDALLGLLADGSWHTINEISTLEAFRKMKITTLMEMLNFLVEYEFIEVNQRLGYDLTTIVIEAKLTSALANFMRKIKWAERSIG